MNVISDAGRNLIISHGIPTLKGEQASAKLVSRRNGRVPEWLKGTGCKPVGYAYLGSNPSAPTISFFERAGCADSEEGQSGCEGAALAL